MKTSGENVQSLESFKLEAFLFFKQDFVSCFQIYRVKSLSITIFVYVLGPFHCLTLRPYGARQAPLSMGFSRQEYWSGSGLPCPPPGDLPNLGIQPPSYWQADFLPLAPPGKPYLYVAPKEIFMQEPIGFSLIFLIRILEH